MGKIYVGQTRLRITVETQADLTDADIFEIKYIKPDDDQTEGSWTATCDDLPGGEIYFESFVTTTLDVAGIWRFWAYITWSGSSASEDESVPGEAFELRVYNEGE
jgi:hypothetical protein